VDKSNSQYEKSYCIKLGTKLISINVLLAFIICAILVFIGTVRILSYSKDGFIAAILEGTIFHYFAYRPESYLNVRFFKILATPSVVALIYFLFRGLNDNSGGNLRHKINNEWRRIDFNSGIFRFCLVTIISICWIPIEVMKFQFGNVFYPYSSLEDPLANSIVLAAGGILCFFLMKYLSFKPLITKLNKFDKINRVKDLKYFLFKFIPGSIVFITG
jgi:hypothetical protein